jgi:hypothetical protein
LENSAGKRRAKRIARLKPEQAHASEIGFAFRESKRRQAFYLT